jgi:predicted dehydrogenase
MAKYRIGVIGHTGRGNYGHGIDTVWLEVPQCEIVAVADPDEQGRAKAVERLKVPKAYADYEQMLDEAKPDIVAICPRWIDKHCEMALAAASRGMHIYMEKPFCRTPAEADTIVAACEKHGVKLALAHQTRYSPKVRVVRELIEDGRIGDVLELRGRGKEDQRGGAEDLWVLGSHVFNLMHYFGGDPLWCMAQMHQGSEPVGRQHVRDGNEGLGPLAGDSLTAMFGMAGGETGYFGSRKGANGNRFGLQIFGSKGMVDLVTGYMPSVWLLEDPAWSPGRSKSAWQNVSSAGVNEPEPLKDGGIPAGNVAAVHDLISAIENDRQPECSMYEGRTTVEMISAVFESHRQGAKVSIPLKQRENALALLST